MKLYSKFAVLLVIPLLAFAQPSKIRLIYPNGGEKFRAGSSVDIIWDTTETYRSRFAFQFGTSPNGPWATQIKLENILDSGTTRGKISGGWRIPAIKTQTGYLRIILINQDGSLNENVSDINDSPFEIEQPSPILPDSLLKTPIKGKVKLTNQKIYALDGYVFVDEGGILEIEPGTIIIGDTVGQNSALCINRGGKIFAVGTPQQPIIFTSSAPPGQRRPGDWGGVLICGRAKTNHPGGEAALEGGIADANRVRGWFGGKSNPDDNDNSGFLRYVRIEFAGIAAAPNQELNGLTLGAVGAGTQIDHVMVSYANDDSYEWFGGSVSAKYIIAFRGLDDDFDGDNGFRGKIQFALSVREPQIADVSGSHLFEYDNDAQGSWNTPLTNAIFSNVTAIGPLKDTSWTTGTGNNEYNPRYSTMVQIRRNARLSLFNSVLIGWTKGLEILSFNSQNAAKQDSIQIRNNFIYGIKSQVFYVDGSNPPISSSWLSSPQFNNFVNLSSPLMAQLMDPFSEAGEINPIPLTNAPYLTSANFNKQGPIQIDDPFFEKVQYCGAFSPILTERWDLPWAEYDPINAAYSKPSSVEFSEKNNIEIKVSPNPATDYIKVLFNNNLEEYLASFKIVDIFGKEYTVFSRENLKNSFYELTLNIEKLPSGIYYLVGNFGEKIISKQFVVIK